MWGDAKNVAKMYERFCWQEQGIVLEHSDTSSENPVELNHSFAGNGTVSSVNDELSVPGQLFQPNPVFEKYRQLSRIGTGDVIIRNFIVLNEAGIQGASFEYDEKLTLCYLLEVCKPVDSDFVLGVRFRDIKGNFVYSANDINRIHRIKGAPGDSIFVSTEFRIPLAHQDYVLLTGIFGFKDGNAFVDGVYDYSRSVIWDVIEDAAYLTVHPCKVMPLAGPVNTCFDLKVRKLDQDAKNRCN
jgi:hypothetical protein